MFYFSQNISYTMRAEDCIDGGFAFLISYLKYLCPFIFIGLCEVSIRFIETIQIINFGNDSLMG